MSVDSNDVNRTPSAFPPVVAAPPPAAYVQPTYTQAPADSMALPVKVLGVCYLALAILGLIGVFFLNTILHFAMVNAQAQNPGTPAMPAGFITLVAIFAGLFAGLLPLITGFGLLTRASWGRVMAIVNGIIILISIPVGTILGGLTLYYMLRTGAKDGYAQLSSSRTAL